MSSQLKVDISLDARGYSDGIKDAKQATEDYNNQVTKTKNELPNLNKQLRTAKQETRNLALAVANLTDEQKKSAEGRKLIKMFQDSQKEAARLQDILTDTNKSIKNLSSDTFVFDAFKDSITGIGSSFSAVAGTIGLVTGQEDKMKQALTGVATTMSVVNGLTSVQNILQKESAVMLGISALQSKAKAAAVDLETAAQGKNIVVTKSATAAQAALNLVADANPYILLASAIIALVGGYVMFEDEINRLIGISNNLTQEEVELREELKNQSSELAKTTNNVYKLSDEWKGLKTEAEQKQWIEDNQAAFDDLGISINSVTDAENVFVKNTPKLLAALEARTMAAAYDALANKKMQEAIDKGKEADIDPTIFEKGLAQAKSTFAKITSGNFDTTLKGIGEAYSGILLNTILNDKKLTNHILKERHDEILDLTEQSKKYLKKSAESLEDYNNKLAEAGIKQANKNRNKTTKTTTPKSDKKSDEPTVEELKQLTEEITNKIKNQSLRISIDYSRDEIQEKIKKLQDLLNKTPLTIDGQFNPEIDKIQAQIDSWTDKLNLKKSIIDEDEFNKSLEKGFDAVAEAQKELDAIEAKNQEKRIQRLDAIGSVIGSTISMFESLGSAFGDSVAANIAAIMAESAANIALSYAKAMAEHKSFTIWDWIPAAAAGLAQMVAVIATMKNSVGSYAGGGVIEGPYHIGDRMIANVNAGEMILNQRQQGNLFDAINKNRLGGDSGSTRLYGTVTVKGSDLNIAMSNFDKTRKKSR